MESVVLSPSSTLSACGDAPAYYQDNSTSINCYGYAADFNWFISPGDIYYTYGSPYEADSTVDEVAGWVIDDFWRADHRPIREISSASASISSTERRIALRIGRRYLLISGSYYDFYDFHFIRQTSTGRWAHKPGSLPSIYTTTNPTTFSWDLYGTDNYGNLVVLYSGFYNSDVVYFAI